jgi:hypothetical protein
MTYQHSLMLEFRQFMMSFYALHIIIIIIIIETYIYVYEYNDSADRKNNIKWRN